MYTTPIAITLAITIPLALLGYSVLRWDRRRRAARLRWIVGPVSNPILLIRPVEPADEGRPRVAVEMTDELRQRLEHLFEQVPPDVRRAILSRCREVLVQLGPAAGPVVAKVGPAVAAGAAVAALFAAQYAALKAIHRRLDALVVQLEAVRDALDIKTFAMVEATLEQLRSFVGPLAARPPTERDRSVFAAALQQNDLGTSTAMRELEMLVDGQVAEWRNTSWKKQRPATVLVNALQELRRYRRRCEGWALASQARALALALRPWVGLDEGYAQSALAELLTRIGRFRANHPQAMVDAAEQRAREIRGGLLSGRAREARRAGVFEKLSAELDPLRTTVSHVEAQIEEMVRRMQHRHAEAVPSVTLVMTQEGGRVSAVERVVDEL